MIKDLLLQSEVSSTVNINTRLYQLRKLGLLRKTNINSFTKKILFLSTLFTELIKRILSTGIYILTIYFIIKKLTGSFNSNIFINVFIFFSIFGAIINSRILKTSKSKYHSVILLNMDCKSYTLSDVFSNIFLTSVIQFFVFILLNSYLKLSLNSIILLTLFLFLIKIVGEGFNLVYYQIKKNTYLNNTILYFVVLIFLISCPVVLSIFKIYISNRIILYTNLVLVLLSIISILEIFKVNNYKYIYKRIMNISSYSDGTVLTKDEIYSINSEYASYVKYNKNPYKYFNNIFMRRHSRILMSPIIRETVVLVLFFITMSVIMCINKTVSDSVSKIIFKYFNALLFIVHILNKTYTTTENMFSNCDKSMLTYDFYKEDYVVKNIFKERLKSLIKINIIPIVVIGLFIPLLLIISGIKLSLELILIPVMLVIVSMFFTTHYLSMYYLLQPYDKDSKVKDLKSQILNIIILLVLIVLIKININLLILEIISIVFSLIYIGICLYLVNKNSQKTFKIKH